MNENLRGLYRTYFDVRCDVSASMELVHKAMRLRYQVYCIENPFEDAAAFPDDMEHDEYDDRSIHSLLVHRRTRMVAGTVRLIRPDPDRPEGSLPVDRVCSDPRLMDPRLLPRATMAEVSRFAISKHFRRRVEDAPTPTGVGPGWRESRRREQRRVPHLSLGLVQAMVSNSAAHGITHWVAEMEPALLRMYARLGIHWQPLGAVVEYHGRRQPCFTKLDAMLWRAYQERPEVWDLITNGGACHCDGWGLPDWAGPGSSEKDPAAAWSATGS